MPEAPEEQKIDELIRDITKVGFMPKSEARRRIMELLSSTKKQKDEEWWGLIKQYWKSWQTLKDTLAFKDTSFPEFIEYKENQVMRFSDSLLNQSEK